MSATDATRKAADGTRKDADATRKDADAIRDAADGTQKAADAKPKAVAFDQYGNGSHGAAVTVSRCAMRPSLHRIIMLSVC